MQSQGNRNNAYKILSMVLWM